MPAALKYAEMPANVLDKTGRQTGRISGCKPTDPDGMRKWGCWNVPKETLSVVVAQLIISDFDREANMRKIEEVVRDVSRCSEAVPDLLLLPELAVEGYAFTKNRWEKYPADDTVKNFYSALAAGSDMHILAGFAERCGGKWYDSAGCFSPDGDVQIYRKIHLWGEEKKFFLPGDSISCMNIAGWKVAVQICADVGFPELSRRQALEGAELIAVIGAWVKPYGYMWRNCCLARATENQIALAASNRLGDFSDGGTFCGISMASDARGRETANLLEKPGRFIARFSKDDMKEWRRLVPWFEMRRPEIYDQDLGLRPNPAGSKLPAPY
jgi:predicted amidohydrolase